MSKTTTVTNAREIADAINVNIDDYYAGNVTYEAFSERSGSLWNKARELAIEAEVGALTVPKAANEPETAPAFTPGPWRLIHERGYLEIDNGKPPFSDEYRHITNDLP